MAQHSRFFSRRQGDAKGEFTYTADDWSEVLSTFFSTGVVGSTLKISAVSNYKLKLSPGNAIIKGHWYCNDTDLILTTKPSTTARKDTIVLRLDKEERNISVHWLEGTELQDNSTYFDFPLANVTVISGTMISALVDRRTYSQALYSLDFDSLGEEWQEYLKKWKAIYNTAISTTNATSELIQSRLGWETLNDRMTVSETKFKRLTTVAGKNVFDADTAKYGELNSSGSIVGNAGESYTSDFIPVSDNDVSFYFWTSQNAGGSVYCKQIAYYEERTDVALRVLNTPVNTVSTLYMPQNTKYFRITFNTYSVPMARLQITKTDAKPATYLPFEEMVRKEAVEGLTNLSSEVTKARSGYPTLSANLSAINNAAAIASAATGFLNVPNCMLSNKNFLTSDLQNWTTLNSGMLEVQYGKLICKGNLSTTADKMFAVYGKLDKELIFDTSQSNIVFIKMRCKSLNGTSYLIPCWRDDGKVGEIISPDNILQATPYTGTSSEPWFEVRDKWTDILIIVGGSATAEVAKKVLEFGVFLRTQSGNIPELSIHSFEVFYSGD